MAKVREMESGAGDKVLVEYDPVDEKAVDEAEREFNLSMFGVATPLPGTRSSKLAFANRGDGNQSMIRRFDRTATDTVIMKPIAGG